MKTFTIEKYVTDYPKNTWDQFTYDLGERIKEVQRWKDRKRKRNHLKTLQALKKSRMDFEKVQREKVQDELLAAIVDTQQQAAGASNKFMDAHKQVVEEVIGRRCSQDRFLEVEKRTWSSRDAEDCNDDISSSGEDKNFSGSSRRRSSGEAGSSRHGSAEEDKDDAGFIRRRSAGKAQNSSASSGEEDEPVNRAMSNLKTPKVYGFADSDSENDDVSSISSGEVPEPAGVVLARIRKCLEALNGVVWEYGDVDLAKTMRKLLRKLKEDPGAEDIPMSDTANDPAMDWAYDNRTPYNSRRPDFHIFEVSKKVGLATVEVKTPWVSQELKEADIARTISHGIDQLKADLVRFKPKKTPAKLCIPFAGDTGVIFELSVHEGMFLAVEVGVWEIPTWLHHSHETKIATAVATASAIMARVGWVNKLTTKYKPRKKNDARSSLLPPKSPMQRKSARSPAPKSRNSAKRQRQ
ncbi:hypothetical protein HDU88_005720 [Geranomyces variabilis]|nr:hypothetical protein HDU88_005720 [Geranomyces variabilis]